MFRIALVEDDAAYRDIIAGYIQRYTEETGAQLEVCPYSDGDEIALHYQADFDIIFMDIEMTYLDGMTAAQEIRKLDERVIIIFITNSPHYAIKGYEVGALDYLLKPVTYFAFSQRLAKAIRQLESRKANRHLNIPIHGGVRRVRRADLLYIESHGHTLQYHLQDETIEGSGTLREWEDALSGSFFCCTKGILVNLGQVTGLTGDDLLVGSLRLPISRARKKAFLEAMNRYSMAEEGQ